MQKKRIKIIQKKNTPKINVYVHIKSYREQGLRPADLYHSTMVLQRGVSPETRPTIRGPTYHTKAAPQSGRLSGDKAQDL